MLDGCRPYSEAERRSASFHSRSLWQLRNSANQVAHGLMPSHHHRVKHLLRPTTASAPFPRAGRCGGNLSRRPYPGTGVELAGSFSSGRWLRRSPLPWHCIDGQSPPGGGADGEAETVPLLTWLLRLWLNGSRRATPASRPLRGLLPSPDTAIGSIAMHCPHPRRGRGCFQR